MYRRFLLLIPFLLSEISAVQSQSLAPQVIASSGGFVVVGDNSLSFTIGQPLALILTSADGSLTQGFQQTIPTKPAVNVITAIEPSPVSALRVFPNPTGEYLHIEGPAATLTLTDVLGRECWQAISTGKPLLISLHGFSGGNYVLNVQTTQATQSIRIILQH